MDNPEYILTDEMGVVVEAVKTQAALPTLNYQYGYVEELNETLKQYEADPTKYNQKFPLVWLAEPYDLERGKAGIYGTYTIDLFIINTTDKTWKATERMAQNYKPILLPIYREWLSQIVLSTVFAEQNVEVIQHRVTKGYYWGIQQQSVLNDAVDCLKISAKLKVHNNQNCTPQNSF